MQYPVETFTDEEAALLRPYVTNLDRPVFCLVNLPETVKAAVFARYSRYQGTLRRLLIDEFSDALDGAAVSESDAADAFFDRVFTGYGDDSVAQLGGAHLACEWSSNLLTKIIQRGRLAAYLEQSTRYILFDKPVGSLGYRYFTPEGAPAFYKRDMDHLFEEYSELNAAMYEYLVSQNPLPEDSTRSAAVRALKAKALDCVRGLLPSSTLSHMGMYASGQSYESLVMHMLAHPLPEANEYGQMILEELQKVIPSFMARVPRPDRGGKWVEYFQDRRSSQQQTADELVGEVDEKETHASVALLSSSGTLAECLAALVFEESGISEEELLPKIEALSKVEQEEMFASIVGERENRRHRPGRGLERLQYRFEIVSDYGAFRDLQRHRMLTCQWQLVTPHLGAEVPADIDEAGLGERFRAALEHSKQSYLRLLEATGDEFIAQNAVSFAYRMRYILDMNAREAMQLTELRSGLEGHPSYRAVAIEMHRLIEQTHPAVGAAFKHVDQTTEPRLERLQAELRNAAKERARQNKK